MGRSYNRDLLRRVDEVLYYIWDPIGVSEEPCARGEYSSYAPQVFKLVEASDTIHPISEYLASIISTRMGFSPDKKRCDHTAEVLLKHKEAIRKGLA